VGIPAIFIRKQEVRSPDAPKVDAIQVLYAIAILSGAGLFVIFMEQLQFLPSAVKVLCSWYFVGLYWLSIESLIFAHYLKEMKRRPEK